MILKGDINICLEAAIAYPPSNKRGALYKRAVIHKVVISGSVLVGLSLVIWFRTAKTNPEPLMVLYTLNIPVCTPTWTLNSSETKDSKLKKLV